MHKVDNIYLNKITIFITEIITKIHNVSEISNGQAIHLYFLLLNNK